MATESKSPEKYYIPDQSRVPIIFAVAALFAGFGAASAVQGNGTEQDRESEIFHIYDDV